jgi:bla regulator protein blaR1
MRYAITATAFAALPLSLTILAVAQNPPLAFEVASVKEHVFSGRGGGIVGSRISGSLVTVSTSTLKRLIQNAYQLQPYEVAGGPSWFNDNLPAYDITARAPDGRTPTAEEARQMLQVLLMDRFKLVFHRETRELTGYALVIAKNGSKLKATSGVPFGARISIGTVRRTEATNMSLAQFIGGLRADLNGPVVDQTGLDGRYDFQLAYLADPLQANTANVNSTAPDLFTALQEQLGLKLEPMKTTVDMMVIDRAEKPGEN